MKAVDPRILKIAKRVHAKRAKTVIDHILKHGQITTEELRDIYGYNHPPRAARDVREQGIPLDTVRVMGKDGRRIGAYRFGNPDNIEWHKRGGWEKLDTAISDKSALKYREREEQRK